jgi:hypothetical protein
MAHHHRLHVNLTTVLTSYAIFIAYTEPSPELVFFLYSK